MNTNARLALLRERFYAPHSTEAWILACEVLDDWPDDPKSRTLGMDYALSAAQRWPDALRVHHPRWRIESDAEMGAAERERWSLVRHLVFTVGGEPHRRSFEKLRDHPVAEVLTHLTLDGLTLDPAMVRILVSPGFLPALTHLSLRRVRLGPERLRKVLRSELGHRLHTLDLSDVGLKTRGVRALTEFEDLDALRELHLCGNAITNEGASALAVWPQAQRLDVLDLSRNAIAYEGARDLSLSLRGGGRLLLENNGLKNTNALALTLARHAPDRQRHLSELLSAPASSETWIAMTVLLDVWPEDDPEGLEAATQSVESVTSDWPDAIKTMHPRWWRARMEYMEALPSDAPVQPLAPPWRLVRTLSLNKRRQPVSAPPWTRNTISHLVRSPGPLVLRMLNIQGNAISLEELSMLGHDPRTSSLRALDLSACRLGSESVRALVDAPYFDGLTHLRVGANSWGMQAIERLLQSPHVGKLVSLDVSNNPLGVEGVLALARAEGLKGLKVLIARGVGATNRCALGLANGRGLSNLEHLELDQNSVNVSGAVALIQGAGMPRLRSLSLQNNTVRRDNSLFSKPERASSLRVLKLNNTRFVGERLETLLNFTRMDGVESLSMSSVGFEDKDVETLVGCPHLGGLRHLLLSSNRIADPGAEVMASAANLGGLVHLDLGNNAIGREGVEAIWRSTALGSLTHLGLYQSVGRARLWELAETPPRFPLEHLGVVHWELTAPRVARLKAVPALAEVEIGALPNPPSIVDPTGGVKWPGHQVLPR